MSRIFISMAALLLVTFAACGQKKGASGQAQAAADTTMMQKQTVPDGVKVLISTTEGDITAVLYNDTPLHRDNFLKLVKEGYYDGVLFHRVINEFMVQTGDGNSKQATPGQTLGDGDPGYTIQAEIDYPRHYHKYGALAAARTGDEVNPERRSSGSQFYIVTGRKFAEPQLEALQQRKLTQRLQARFGQLVKEHHDQIQALQAANDTTGLEALRQQLITETESSVPNVEIPQEVKDTYATMGGTPHLDNEYTVFGEVIQGMDVVEKIQKAETDSSDRPKTDIRILSVKVLDQPAAPMTAKTAPKATKKRKKA